jgi:hypothetical protein
VEMLSQSAAVEVDVSMVERVRAADANQRERPRTIPGVSFPATNRPFGSVGEQS